MFPCTTYETRFARISGIRSPVGTQCASCGGEPFMATKTSFKQQCPSCEAMVPIRDPGLIGRKIDCPKCKYRFVVDDKYTLGPSFGQVAPVGVTLIRYARHASPRGGPRAIVAVPGIWPLAIGNSTLKPNIACAEARDCVVCPALFFN